MIPIFKKFVKMLDTNVSFKYKDGQLIREESKPRLRFKIAYIEFALRKFNNILQELTCPKNSKSNPHLGSDKLEFFGRYNRATIWDFVDGKLVPYENVQIWRCQCPRDGSTHALLMWLLPPYSRHTYRLIFSALSDFYNHTATNEIICEKYDITEKTLSAWRKKFESDFRTMCQLITDKVLNILDLLKILIGAITADDVTLFETFFKTNQYTFMGPRQAKTSKPHEHTPESNSTPNHTCSVPVPDSGEEAVPESASRTAEEQIWEQPVPLITDPTSNFRGETIPAPLTPFGSSAKLGQRGAQIFNPPSYIETIDFIHSNLEKIGWKRHDNTGDNNKNIETRKAHSSPWTRHPGLGRLTTAPRSP